MHYPDGDLLVEWYCDADGVSIAGEVGHKCFTGCIDGACNPECEGILGDINKDNILSDELDVPLMRDIVKGLNPYDVCADMDGDGFIGPVDVNMLDSKIRLGSTE
jgi:hypothetical protein